MLELRNDILQGLREDVLRLLDARPPDDQPFLLVRLRDDMEMYMEDVLKCNLPVVLQECGWGSSILGEQMGNGLTWSTL